MLTYWCYTVKYCSAIFTLNSDLDSDHELKNIFNSVDFVLLTYTTTSYT